MDIVETDGDGWYSYDNANGLICTGKEGNVSYISIITNEIPFNKIFDVYVNVSNCLGSRVSSFRISKHIEYLQVCFSLKTQVVEYFLLLSYHLWYKLHHFLCFIVLSFSRLRS